MVEQQYPMGEKYFASNSCSDKFKKQKNANFFVKTLKNHGRGRLFSKESIENIKIYNKNKGVLSNNFDRTVACLEENKWKKIKN